MSAKNQRIDLMFDIETTGKNPGCSILTIGATVFRFHSPVDSFYARCSLHSNEAVGLTNDKDTMKWWSEQSKEAQEEAFGGNSNLKSVLYDLVNYVSHLPADEVHWWCNGASFDFPILEEAFRRCGMVAPWNYKNMNCYRTLKNLFPYVKALEMQGAVKHHALWDAKYQAEHCTALLNWSDRCQSIK